MGQVEGKVAIVTGGASGIGAALRAASDLPTPETERIEPHPKLRPAGASKSEIIAYLAAAAAPTVARYTVGLMFWCVETGSLDRTCSSQPQAARNSPRRRP
jgi:hypothetical protein